MLIGIPVFVEAEFLINLWLGKVPEYVIPFLRITLIECFFKAIDFPIGSGIHAFGKMKLPNITSSIVYLSALPLVYVALSLGCSPVAAYVIVCIVYPVALGFDLWILNKYSNFNVHYYLIGVPLKSVLFVICASLIPLLIVDTFEPGFCRLLLSATTSVLISSLLIFYIGLDHQMRKKVVLKFQKVLHLKR